jgi:hypothetical protein
VSTYDPRDDYDDEPWRRRRAPEQKVRTPATIIEVFGAIQLGLSLLGFVAAVVVAVIDRGFAREIWTPDTIAVVAASLVGLGWNVVVRRGAAGMARFQRYRRALLSAALAIVPTPFVFCGAFSLPIGLWALAMLLRPDVRARFAVAARGNIAGSLPGPTDAHAP